MESRSVGDEHKPKFAGDIGFYPELKRRVADYFAHSGESTHDNPRMYGKTAILLLWFAGSYSLLVFVATTWWQGVLFSCAVATAIAGLGFCVAHDANHGAYSKYRFVNRLMGLTLDFLGASSYVWRWKHNVSHHTYTNILGADDDIDIPLARISPQYPHRGIHRAQHFYLWVLYGFMIAQWHFVTDTKSLLLARVARNRMPRPRGWDLVELIAGKVAFLGWVFVIPLCSHRWWVVALFYALTVFVAGFMLSITFLLAHCVEEANFPDAATRMPDGWAAHQVQTTVNFSPRNRFLSWYLGGLNFQIEHHLFPRICHVNYRRISPIVQAVCAEYGVRYTAHPSIARAIASHWRWLHRMGRGNLA